MPSSIVAMRFCFGSCDTPQLTDSCTFKKKCTPFLWCNHDTRKVLMYQSNVWPTSQNMKGTSQVLEFKARFSCICKDFSGSQKICIISVQTNAHRKNLTGSIMMLSLYWSSLIALQYTKKRYNSIHCVLGWEDDFSEFEKPWINQKLTECCPVTSEVASIHYTIYV